MLAARNPYDAAAAASAAVQGPHGDQQQCFEEDCRSSPFMMHASSTSNGSEPDTVVSCFQFVAIGCYAAPKGCCPMVARRFTGMEFDISEWKR